MTSFAEKYGKKQSFTATAAAGNNAAIESKANAAASAGAAAADISHKAAAGPIDLQKRALAELIYLVKGVDAGRNAWYYVLVERNKVQLFLKALNDDIIHLEHYGKILYSAYGDEPPAEITQKLKDEYGIK